MKFFSKKDGFEVKELTTEQGPKATNKGILILKKVGSFIKKHRKLFIIITLLIIVGQSFFSWDYHHVMYRLVTPPLTGWKSNAVRLSPTVKNSRTI